jgi:hypothetical protein
MKTLLPIFALVCTVSGAARAADDAVVLHCRTLHDTASRLACYDAMPVAEQRFGARQIQTAPKEAEPADIRSTIVGHIDGWKLGTVFKLANGQAWRVADEYDAMLPDMDNPAVVISRGALGAYFLEVVGNKHSARVVRIK